MCEHLYENLMTVISRLCVFYRASFEDVAKTQDDASHFYTFINWRP
jgi:hypothetical protein